MSSRTDSTPETVLITGASAGIGLELARIFAQHKSNLILVARREDTLKSLAGELSSKHKVDCRVLAADLADPTAPTTIFEYASKEGMNVDVVVNNAGFGANGKFAELPAQTQLNILQVNITALVHLSRLFLPSMIERRKGGILNVASTAAFVPGPLMAVYYSSKAFVLSFSEALANELAGTGVHVSCLCPGATATEFQSVANMKNAQLFEGPLVMDAATVARMGYDGLRRNQAVVICGLANQMLVAASRVIPRDVSAAMARRIQEN